MFHPREVRVELVIPFQKAIKAAWSVALVAAKVKHTRQKRKKMKEEEETRMVKNLMHGWRGSRRKKGDLSFPFSFCFMFAWQEVLRFK